MTRSYFRIPGSMLYRDLQKNRQKEAILISPVIPLPRLAVPHPAKLRFCPRTLSLAVERLLHTQEVTGSIPVASSYFFRPVQ